MSTQHTTIEQITGYAGDGAPYVRLIQIPYIAPRDLGIDDDSAGRAIAADLHAADVALNQLPPAQRNTALDLIYGELSVHTMDLVDQAAGVREAIRRVTARQ